jgi:hypothetical protein
MDMPTQQQQFSGTPPTRAESPVWIYLRNNADTTGLFYDGTIENLTGRLKYLIGEIEKEHPLPNQHRARELVQRFKWKNLAPILDQAAEIVFQTAAVANKNQR